MKEKFKVDPLGKEKKTRITLTLIAGVLGLVTGPGFIVIAGLAYLFVTLFYVNMKAAYKFNELQSTSYNYSIEADIDEHEVFQYIRNNIGQAQGLSLVLDKKTPYLNFSYKGCKTEHYIEFNNNTFTLKINSELSLASNIKYKSFRAIKLYENTYECTDTIVEIVNEAIYELNKEKKELINYLYK